VKAPGATVSSSIYDVQQRPTDLRADDEKGEKIDS